MIHQLRRTIGNKIVDVLRNANSIGDISSLNVYKSIKVLSKNDEFFFGINVDHLFSKKIQKSKESDVTMLLIKALTGLEDVCKIGIVPTTKKTTIVGFNVKRASIMNEVVDTVMKKPNHFWQDSPMLTPTSENIVVDYSSPNIAKPFHMGHLRSTIIGNFICNVHSSLGHNVTRLNYLGDWGTQFGLLKYGYDALKQTPQDLQENGMNTLYNTYVWANKEAEKDPEVAKQSRLIFQRMEDGDEDELAAWRLFKDITIKELKQTYDRINIKFDVFHGESMYSSAQFNPILDELKEKNLIKTLEDGRMVYTKRLNPKREETLVKSDGTLLYLTRDIAAAIHRQQLFSFKKMIYVTDRSQSDHFRALFHILESMNRDWSRGMSHCSFGRITGMSTRKGTAVFLNDIVDEARNVVLEGILKSKNEQRPSIINEEENAEIVAVNSILLFDFTRKRTSDYSFSWDAILRDENSLGLSLQYAHCRLVNLEKNCGIDLNPTADISLLIEDLHMFNLVLHLIKFDECLFNASQSLEATPLVNFLKDLKQLCNIAYKHHPVKDAKKNIAEARLRIFVTARHTMAATMRILGIRPLDSM